jgi:hypothetical protein
MDSNGTMVAKRDPINHVKVVVLAVIASLIIMLIGIGVQSTEDINGYGVAWSDARQ